MSAVPTAGSIHECKQQDADMSTVLTNEFHDHMTQCQQVVDMSAMTTKTRFSGVPKQIWHIWNQDEPRSYPAGPKLLMHAENVIGPSMSCDSTTQFERLKNKVET